MIIHVGRRSVLVDDDFTLAAGHVKICTNGYPVVRTWVPTGCSKDKRREVALHRIIMNAQPGVMIDHANRDPLDNRRCNLRACTPSQNSCNRKARGYSKHKSGKYQVKIVTEGKHHYLGLYDTKEEAAAAYGAASKVLRGEFAARVINPKEAK